MQILYYPTPNEEDIKRLYRVPLYQRLRATITHAEKKVRYYADLYFGKGNYRLVMGEALGMPVASTAVHDDGRVISLEP
jgi:hypothetical protein